MLLEKCTERADSEAILTQSGGGNVYIRHPLMIVRTRVVRLGFYLETKTWISDRRSRRSRCGVTLPDRCVNKPKYEVWANSIGRAASHWINPLNILQIIP